MLISFQYVRTSLSQDGQISFCSLYSKQPWLLVRKRTILTEQPPRPVKLVPTLVGRWCCEVNASDPCGRQKLYLKWEFEGGGGLSDTESVNHGSAICIVTGYGLCNWRVRVIVPLELRFSPLYIIQTCSGAHPPSYQVGTGGCSPSGKAAGAQSWPLISS
jgi:hypothetical protein